MIFQPTGNVWSRVDGEAMFHILSIFSEKYRDYYLKENITIMKLSDFFGH